MSKKECKRCFFNSNGTKEVCKYIYDRNRPSGKYSSVRFKNDNKRFCIAEQQSTFPIPDRQRIIELTNNFLGMIGMEAICNPKFFSAKLQGKSFYKDMKKNYGLASIADIVWMKFTKEGHLGVVAVSNDINFQMPKSKGDYHKKNNNKWEFNTSGIIIHYLYEKANYDDKKKWDESFVLVFPLQNIPPCLNRRDIECGIGNYLIANEVPILDYFSHRY